MFALRFKSARTTSHLIVGHGEDVEELTSDVTERERPAVDGEGDGERAMDSTIRVSVDSWSSAMSFRAVVQSSSLTKDTKSF